jgi:hypothetical protein
MVFNDVGQVVKAVINGSTLLTGRAVDRIFPSGSLGGLTNTLDTYGSWDMSCGVSWLAVLGVLSR